MLYVSWSANRSYKGVSTRYVETLTSKPSGLFHIIARLIQHSLLSCILRFLINFEIEPSVLIFNLNDKLAGCHTVCCYIQVKCYMIVLD